jgi:hypothetical protein
VPQDSAGTIATSPKSPAASSLALASRVDRVFATLVDALVGLTVAIPVGIWTGALGGILSLADMLFILRKDRRCIHDLVAGTQVLNVER